MRLNQLYVDRYQPLMQAGQHQRQKGASQHRAYQQTAAIDSPARPVRNGVRNPAPQRLQRHDRNRAGNERGQQRVKNELQRPRQPFAKSLFKPAHQGNHQQHGDHPAAPWLQGFAKQGNLRQLRAGENTCHHPA